MQQTAAKALIRKFFYQEFLPGQLSRQLLQGSNYLVLLGESPEEEYLLSELGVPSHRIYSVERDPQVFATQSMRARRGELKVVLYYGELVEFITHYLHTNQRFQILNLDICGSYKNGIDPVMTPILLFARRNPQTVIATYSSVGRDRPQLLEGLKSLAICMWLAPSVTSDTMKELYGRYRSAGLSSNVCFNMILRHLFWLRSHLEHTLLGSVAMNKVNSGTAQKLITAFDACWQHVSKTIRLPLQFGDFMSTIANYARSCPKSRVMDLSIQSATVVTYESFNHFYHTGWFSIYQRITPQSTAEWVEHGLNALVFQPLRFVDQHATMLNSYSGCQETLPNDLEIWSRSIQSSPGRSLRIPLPSPRLKALGDFLDSVPNGPAINPAVNPISSTEELGLTMSNGATPKQLSQSQIERIRNAARKKPDATTDQIVRSLQLQNYPKGSITAHIAIARRKS